MASGEAGAVIGVLFSIFFLACLYWIYERYFRHPKVDDEERYDELKTEKDSTLPGNSKKRLNKSSKQKANNDISSLLFPEVSNPLVDIELGNDMEVENDDDYRGESLENVLTEGICKAGYLKKKSTGIRKGWLIRYFFVKDGKLYHVHESEELIGKRNVSARLVANLLISTVKEISEIEFQIISPGQRGSNAGGGVYELQGDNSDDMNDWVRIIRRQIEGALVQIRPSEQEDSTNIERTGSDLFLPGQNTIDELRIINPYCADCGALSPEWASINLCIMICIDCSGIHRKLGTHVSKVRSITLDKWTSYNLQLMLTIGNERANAIWEASLGNTEERSEEGPLKCTASSTMEEREKFILRKYVQREYVFAKDASQEHKELHLLKSAYDGDLIGTIAAIAAGAEVNMITSEDSRTALHFACEGHHTLCVGLLCQLGAVCDIADNEGLTSYDIASRMGFQDVIDILNSMAGKSPTSSIKPVG